MGIGDDTAVWHTEKSIQLGTTDILIEGIHFKLDMAGWRDLGWKALAINISDIAAMGGVPRYALVSLGLPPETEVDEVREFYSGLMEVAGKFDVMITGGNISSAPQVIINVSLIGESPYGLLTRSAAMPGDQIAVTGYLGQAAAGLKVLSSGLDLDPKTEAFLKEAHLRPYPRVAEGHVLVRHGVKTAIDLSDGLLSDLVHVCTASRVAANIRLNRLPIHPLMKAAFPDESLMIALSGGEDYELMFTAGSEVIDRLKWDLPTPLTVIGEIESGEPGNVTLVNEQGEVVEIKERGWEHFKS
jgi:thiamine-monophosphate kinase